MIEYMVQFRNYWSEKNGDVRPKGTMSLDEAQRYVAEHPETEYIILQRTGGAEPSLWTPVAPDDAKGEVGPFSETPQSNLER